MTVPAAVFPKAQRHLARRDPILQRLIAAIGPCTLTLNPDRFGTLARSIISQQISTKAALAISARLHKALKNSLTPRKIVRASDETLRGAGLSASKQRALRDLSEKVLSGAVPLDDFDGLDDEAVIARLLPVFGIGRWTAQMFLIFSLGRMDVLPVDDFGLRHGMQIQYELAEMPGRKEMLARAACWQPYRTVGTWYFWRSFGAVPQSDA